MASGSPLAVSASAVNLQAHAMLALGAGVLRPLTPAAAPAAIAYAVLNSAWAAARGAASGRAAAAQLSNSAAVAEVRGRREGASCLGEGGWERGRHQPPKK